MSRVKGQDIGYNSTKSIGDYDERLIFNSAYSTSDDVIACEAFITIDGKDYYVGTGNSTSKPDKTNDKINKVCTLTNLAMTGDNDYFLVHGLPIGQYKSQRDKLIETIMGYNKSEVVYYNKKINIQIKDVTVYPQGAAALYSMDKVDGNFIIVDIGGFTVDVSQIEMVNCSPIIVKYDTWFDGLSTIYSDVIKKINNKYSHYNLTLDVSEAENIIRNGLNIDKVRTDIKKDIEDLLQKLADKIMAQLERFYPSAHTKDIFLCGGGANLLYQMFKKQYKGIELIPDSQFANALGYYCIGQQKYYNYVYN